MKALSFLLILFPGLLMAQKELTPAQIAKAEEKGRSEWAQMEKKGWKALNPTDDPLKMITDYWKQREFLDDQGNSLYAYPTALGSGNTPAEALTDATAKAHDGLTGIISLYFQSWNMTNSSKHEKETAAVDKAIQKTENDWKTALRNLEGKNTVAVMRMRGSQTEVQVRMSFLAEDAKGAMRNILLGYLKKNNNWTDDMGKQFLYFKASKPGISISVGK